MACLRPGGSQIGRKKPGYVPSVPRFAPQVCAQVCDSINIRLTDQTEAQLARVPIEYDSGFTLLPGTYHIKILVRDDETGRIGTYETTFTIPNLNKEGQRVPISSVVLSSQRVPLQDALYNTMKGKESALEAAANPLVSDGGKLIPSVTRVFSGKHPLYVYLQGYESATGVPAATNRLRQFLR